MPCTTSRVFLSTKTDIKIRKAGKEEKFWNLATHETDQKNSCVPALQICLLVSWVPDSFLFSLVNHDLVSVGVINDRGPTNWCLALLKEKLRSALFQSCDSGINVIYLKGN